MTKLAAQREKLDLTQEELSEKSGISVRTIQRIEAGASLKGHTLKTLARALDVSEEFLTKKTIAPEMDSTIVKLINFSSLLVTFIPPANIVFPLLIMWIKREFNPLTKQIVSLQILWTIVSTIIFLLSAFLKNWFSLHKNLVLFVMILLILSNVIIILRNAKELDKNNQLFIKLNFNII